MPIQIIQNQKEHEIFGEWLREAFRAEEKLSSDIQVIKKLFKKKKKKLSEYSDGDSKTRKINKVISTLDRMFVRAYFAYAEYAIYLMAEISLNFPQDHSPLSDIDRMALREETVEISDKGETSTRNAKISLLKRFRLAHNNFCEVAATQHIDFSNHGFECFKKSIHYRDRITHPKKWEELNFTKEEEKHLTDGSMWFLEEFLRLLEEFAKNYQEALNEAGYPVPWNPA